MIACKTKMKDMPLDCTKCTLVGWCSCSPSRAAAQRNAEIYNGSRPDECPLIDTGKASKPKEPKRRYGEHKNVLLTDTQVQKLIEKLPDTYAEWIEELSGSMESKGVNYKNHYATILVWVRREQKKKQESLDGLPERKPSYDIEELENLSMFDD